MKLKIVEGHDSELFESKSTQVATLEITEQLLMNADVVRRARQLIEAHGSSQALEEFDLAIKRRIKK